MSARKRFGQHFLEPAWAERVVVAVAPGAGESFLEIGPGRGALTFPLARRAGHVTAVEIDRDLVEELSPHLPGNVRLVSGDVLQTPVESLWPAGTDLASIRVVGNLPYNISSPILFRLLELHRTGGAFADATVMLQREVAERVAAPPGSKTYGVLSIAVQLEAEVTPLLSLPPGAFRPAPEVSSAVIRLRFRPHPVQIDGRALFDGLVRCLFTHRRKTAANAMKSFAALHGTDGPTVLRAVGIEPSRRPETLSLAELAAIANHLGAGAPATMV